MDFTIFEKDIKTPEELPFKEDLPICHMQSLRPNGLYADQVKRANETYWA